jgi:hypothetical protein
VLILGQQKTSLVSQQGLLNKFFKNIVYGDIEDDGDHIDLVHAGVDLASLNPADLRIVHARFHGQLFHGEIFRYSQAPDPFAQ